MAELVKAKSTAKGSKTEFLIDKRLAAKYPDHFKVIDKDPPAPKNEVGVELAD